MDNVLPLASRRNPTSIATILKQPVIEGLFKYYEDALKQLFNFFATSSQQLTKGKNMVLSTRERTKTFDEQVNLIEEAKVRSHIQTSHANMLAYKDFLRFANDFGLSSR